MPAAFDSSSWSDLAAQGQPLISHLQKGCGTLQGCLGLTKMSTAITPSINALTFRQIDKSERESILVCSGTKAQCSQDEAPMRPTELPLRDGNLMFEEDKYFELCVFGISSRPKTLRFLTRDNILMGSSPKYS